MRSRLKSDALRSRSTIAVVALVLLGAGCSGSGGSTPQPVAAVPTATPMASSGPQSGVTATFTVTIPNPSKGPSARRRQYVSAGTQSIEIATTPSGGKPASPTIVNVASAACVAGSGGTTCHIGVAAAIGSDAFVVTTYDQPNATGAVLSTGTVTGTVVAGQANAFPLVLDGTVAKIVLNVANVYLPTAQKGSANLAISAFDASNEQIVGTYSAPITITGATGLTPSIASIATSTTSSFSVAYDGVSRTPLALVAKSGGASATVQVVPETNVLYYPLSDGPENNPFQMVRGPDGAYYFGEIIGFHNNLTGQQTAPGRIGRIDEAGNITEVQLPDENPIGLLFVGNDLYVALQTSFAVGRIKNAGAGGFTLANYSHILMPKDVVPSSGNINNVDEPRLLALGPDGNVYVTNYSGNDVAYFNPTTFGNGTITEIPTNPANAHADGIAYAPNGKFYISTLNQGNISANVLDSFAPQATSMTELVPTNADTTVPAEYRFMKAGSDGNIYFSENDFTTLVPGAAGRLTQLNVSTGAYTQIAFPTPYAEPDSIETGPPGTLLFVDVAQNAVDVMNLSNLSLVSYPLVTSFSNADVYPDDIGLDPDGSIWFTAPSFAAVSQTITDNVPSKIGHLILASGWTLYPNLATLDINGLGAPSAQLLGVAGSATAGVTFTATSSNTNVCTVTKPAGFTVNFLITGVSNGTCTVSVTDGTRTATRVVDVTSNTVVIDTRRASARVLP